MDIVEELIEFLGGKCALCRGAYPDCDKKGRPKTWLIHHRNYRCADCGKVIPHKAKICPYCGGKPEKDSRDFKERIPHIITRGKRKGMKRYKPIYHKQEYYEYLRPIVFARSEDFAPLHNSCHQAVSRLARWKEPNLKRLYKLALEQK